MALVIDDAIIHIDDGTLRGSMTSGRMRSPAAEQLIGHGGNQEQGNGYQEYAERDDGQGCRDRQHECCDKHELP